MTHAIDWGTRYPSCDTVAPRPPVAPRPGQVQIIVGWFALCLTCRELIELGARAHWQPPFGAWHLHCARPACLEEAAR